MSHTIAVRPLTLSWVDLTADDLRRARELLRALREEGVLDELGFGIFQDAIADRLYPATSTVMTRSRYVYLLPSIYRFLEREIGRGRLRGRGVEGEARTLQHRLRDVLAKSVSPPDGVIGIAAEDKLKRIPSMIYWAALRHLGLFRHRLSERAYLAEIASGAVTRAIARDDDRALHALESGGGFWDRTAPAIGLDQEGHFPAGTSFRLTREEARDLERRHASLHTEIDTAIEHSLLSHLVRVGARAVPYPWLAPDQPTELRRILQHARALSVLARGATLQYHWLLLRERERQGLDVPEVDVPSAFSEWWDRGRGILSGWDHAAFLLRFPEAVRQGDGPFLERWLSRTLASARALDLLEDAEAQRLVRDRERDKRGPKARLRSAAHLRQWKGPSRPYTTGEALLYGLRYRHDIGMTFVADMLDGLGR